MIRLMCLILLSTGYNTCLLAQVTGTVRLEGKSPEPEAIDVTGVPECAGHRDGIIDESLLVSETGALQNVVVSVSPEDVKRLPQTEPSDRPAVLDQQRCTFVPHVLVLSVGQKILIKNSDDAPHNVHPLSDENPIEGFSQEPRDTDGRLASAVTTPEVFSIKCDIHPWMIAWVVVVEQSYARVTDDTGKFDLGVLPDGRYTLVAWHEKLGTQEQKIDVKDGKTAVEFVFKIHEK